MAKDLACFSGSPVAGVVVGETLHEPRIAVLELFAEVLGVDDVPEGVDPVEVHPFAWVDGAHFGSPDHPRVF
jgi:hypothetical protein